MHTIDIVIEGKGRGGRDCHMLELKLYIIEKGGQGVSAHKPCTSLPIQFNLAR